jgi:hypothetical protein
MLKEIHSSLDGAKYRKLGYSAPHVCCMFGNVYIRKQTLFHKEHK